MTSYSSAAVDNAPSRTGALTVAIPPPQQSLPASACAGTAVCSTPEVINSIISIYDNGYPRRGGGPPSFDGPSDSPRPHASPPQPTLPCRMPNICPSLLIKEELKLAIQSKRRNAAAAAAAAAIMTTAASTAGGGPRSGRPGACVAVANASSVAATPGSAASSPGGGQAKRRRTDEESHDDDDDEDDGDVSSHGEGLTAEDEERRRRRRERNKIAATKCRLKKREKTSNLMQESNVLETKNYDLKTQIQELETQRDKLMQMLSTHPCTKKLSHEQQCQPPHQSPLNQHQSPLHQHQSPLHQHQQPLHLQHQQQQHHHQQHLQHLQHQHVHHQQQHQHHQQQQHQQQREQYAAEPYTDVQPYVQHHQVVVVAAEPPILKDAMFNGGGGGGYAPAATAPVRQTTAAYQGPATATAATVAPVHYPSIGGGGVYGSCVDDLYGYDKDLISGAGVGGPPDMGHQYYNDGIC